MADFNFFLNRQGVRGNKGEQGEQGYSPRITVKTETAAEYVLNVQNEDGSFDTPNLRGNAIENLGGTYVRYNQDTEQMYTGYADTASTTSQGEVTLSTYEDLTSGGDESEVTTSKDVHDFVEAKISEASVNYVDIDDYTQKMGELDAEISDLDENKLDFTGLANTLDAGTNITITPNAQTGKITIAGEPVSQAQADWNQSDDTAPDYIKNKPTIPEAITVDSELSSTSTNPVQNRLITNAINLISNEFENYATNKLDNLSSAGEARLHALKCYSDNGELLTDAEGLADVIKYAHSTFDRSKFTVVGSATITDDGIINGTDSSNFAQANFTVGNLANSSWEVYSPLITNFSESNISLNLIALYSANYGADGGIRVSNGGKTLAMLINTVADTNPETRQNNRLSTSTNLTSAPAKLQTKMVFDIVAGTYKGYYNIFDGNGWQQIGSTLTPTTTNKQLYDIVYSPNASLRFRGSTGTNTNIDLKYTKAIVNGIEVFSGNRTGIDTIKPDNYTVVGTPTISADGVASGFSSSNYLSNNQIIDMSKPWECTMKVLTANNIATQQILLSLGSGNSEETRFGYSIYVINNCFGFNLSFDGSSWAATPQNNPTILANTNYWLKFGWNGTTYYIKVSTDNNNYDNYLSYNSTSPIYRNRNLDTIGIWVKSDNSFPFFGSIDLNSFKIYVDGNLVYQPCLKIPYALSKTGSKIVNSINRDRVNDMASQFGSANYYTLDENNGNFTLPQVELYGLIEKAASTVPSGVVQSSTIRNIVSLTQAEYDALATKDANTFYVITTST